ncbi:MAG TPA: FHA domain-containing protein [Gryllotalpicola sp.]
MAGQDGYITPPPGLLPPPRMPEGVPEREQIRAVPGGLPLFSGLPQPSTPPVPAAPAPASAPPQRSWSLLLADGSRLALDGASYVGRNPVVADAAPRAALLPLSDPQKSLSKTHALLVPQLEYLMVTDLHSTNGVAAVAPDGSVTVLEPGRTAAVLPGSTLQLGSFAVRVLLD